MRVYVKEQILTEVCGTNVKSTSFTVLVIFVLLIRVGAVSAPPPPPPYHSSTPPPSLPSPSPPPPSLPPSPPPPSTMFTVNVAFIVPLV